MPSTPDAGWRFALRALRHRNYRLFFGGQSVSLIGTWMTRVATAWLVYRLTNSALLLGLVGFAGQIPTFLCAPFAGVWVDRWNRRRVLVATQTLAMLQSAALAVLALGHIITIWEIVVLSACQGLINAFDMPGRQAFLVQMVEAREDLGNAIALNSSMVNMARLLGPSLAGIVIAVSSEGWCFLIDAVSYLFVIVSLLAMRDLVAGVVAAQARVMQALGEGWQYVSRFAPTRSILLLLAIVSLVGMPYSVLMPLYAGNVLHGGAHAFGFLMGASGLGALCAAVALAGRKSVRGLGRVVTVSAALFGAGLVGLGFDHIYLLALPLMFITGLGMMQQMAAANTILQTIVDDDKRGRVMSYYTMALVGMAPFGSLLAGAMAHAIGAPRTVIVSGISCALGGLWFWSRMGRIRSHMRPIYQQLGIVPYDENPLEEAIEG